MMDRILKIKNDSVWPMQRRVDEIFRLRPRKIQSRPAQPVAWRRFRQRDLLRRGLAPKAQSRPLGRRLDPRGNDEGQRAFVVEGDAGMLDAKHLQDMPRLRQYGVAIVRSDPRLH